MFEDGSVCRISSENYAYIGREENGNYNFALLFGPLIRQTHSVYSLQPGTFISDGRLVILDDEDKDIVHAHRHLTKKEYGLYRKASEIAANGKLSKTPMFKRFDYSQATPDVGQPKLSVSIFE